LTVTPEPPEEEPHCSYTGAAKVDPAPEIVEAALLVALVELEVLEEVVELDLPQAARPNASSTEPRTAPILFVVTRSPSLDCLYVCQQGKRTRLPTRADPVS
jgi:hypothetical protein